MLDKSACASFLIKMLCLFKPKPTLLGPLITFVNNFHALLNLVVLSMCIAFVSSVINSI